MWSLFQVWYVEGSHDRWSSGSGLSIGWVQTEHGLGCADGVQGLTGCDQCQGRIMARQVLFFCDTGCLKLVDFYGGQRGHVIGIALVKIKASSDSCSSFHCWGRVGWAAL